MTQFPFFFGDIYFFIAVVAALQLSLASSNTALIEQALRAMYALCRSDVANRTRMLEAGGCEGKSYL